MRLSTASPGFGLRRHPLPRGSNKLRNVGWLLAAPREEECKHGNWEDEMKLRMTRRTLVKAGAALAGTTVFSPPILSFAQGESPIKIGMHDPFTGTYAAEGESEKRGALMALAEVNQKGGINGRKVELVTEDDAANAGLAAQKAHKLIEQDK